MDQKILISHRGNLKGRITELENKPEYIMQAIGKGFDVEVDFWKFENDFFLGHDSPEYKVDEDFLLNGALWLHAKNFPALQWGIEENLNVFWHETDKVAVTNHGYIWAYPGVLCKNAITVLPETLENISKSIIDEIFDGICSDNIEDYFKEFYGKNK
jgi:hypothetical protein